MARGFYPFQRPSSQPSETNNNNSREQGMNSSRIRMSLPLTNHMAVPIYTVPTREEVEVGGRVLLHDFIHAQFEAENLSDDVLGVHNSFPAGPSGDVGPSLYSASSASMASTPEGYTNERWLQIGGNIRIIADQFAVSKERPLIKRQADQVDLGHINQENFFRMLNEIFRDGINKHCIVALFFFCSDVLIRCVRQRLEEKGAQLFLWCMQFLVERVCKWVHDNGGWEKVFSNIYKVVFRVSAIVALGIIISCGFVWIRKNL